MNIKNELMGFHMSTVMTNDTPWEAVGIGLLRFKIDGGYLYLANEKAMCFVPDITFPKLEPVKLPSCIHGFVGNCQICINNKPVPFPDVDFPRCEHGNIGLCQICNYGAAKPFTETHFSRCKHGHVVGCDKCHPGVSC